jgi:hypothetical protein
MFLQSASIKNFRSIEDLHLEHCSGLNVLIGKNNAGKSNILTAMNGFFTSIRGGRVVVPRVPIGNELNFFNKNISEPIEITLKFSLALAERDALLRDIAFEAPHVKNALDGLDPTLHLSVTLAIRSAPEQFAIVNRIGLHPASEGRKQDQGVDRLILEIGSEAASELSAKASRGQQLMKDVKALKELPDRIPQVFRARAADREQIPINYFLRNYEIEISPEVCSGPHFLDRKVALS